MTDITQIIQSGSSHAWLYIPVAILLGALHGLEPGHSKTMMAAFIIAIRGTVWLAVLLGLSAAIFHSLLIWVLAALALHYGGQWNAEHRRRGCAAPPTSPAPSSCSSPPSWHGKAGRGWRSRTRTDSATRTHP
jgi:hypothetical protein